MKNLHWEKSVNEFTVLPPREPHVLFNTDVQPCKNIRCTIKSLCPKTYSSYHHIQNKNPYFSWPLKPWIDSRYSLTLLSISCSFSLLSYFKVALTSCRIPGKPSVPTNQGIIQVLRALFLTIHLFLVVSISSRFFTEVSPSESQISISYTSSLRV